MISPGLAYAIGYEPHRLRLVHATTDLLARAARNPAVMSNPELNHAVEFATKGAKIEAAIASEKVNAMIARANASGAGLPPLPAEIVQWPAWIDDLATHVKPALAGNDVELAFDAGVAAAALMAAWGVAEKLAYLRGSDPDQADLRNEAARNASQLEALTRGLDSLLARSLRPMVTQTHELLRTRFQRAPRADAVTSATFSSSYAEIAHWRRGVDGLLSVLESDFDAPLDPQPTAEPSAIERQLFKEILERPNDDSLRRRYADLAVQRLDPRAELIREQLAIRELELRGELLLGKHPERVQQLLVSHPEWTSPLTELGAYDVKFDRGFPYEITIGSGEFLAHAAKLFERAPITSVRLRGGLAGRGAALAAVPQLTNVVALDLYEQGITDADVAALAASPYVSNLHTLNLGRNRLSDAGIEVLVASTQLTRLERVNLELNPGADPVDRLEYYNETEQEPVPTEAGRALELKYGRRRWFHPHGADR